ncbi:MAG: hypothetical protein ACRC9E_13230 [Plesiomonas shigelloides]
MAEMIESPSQYYDRLVAGLTTRLVGDIPVLGYEDFGSVPLNGPAVFIQFEDAHPSTRRPDGRYQHQFLITAHCVVPASVPRAVLVAIDLASEVERVIDLNTFGLSSSCCGQPDIQVNGDTGFMLGVDGVESRGVQWIQPLYLGAGAFTPSPIRDGVRFAVNPDNPDDPNAYRPLL